MEQSQDSFKDALKWTMEAQSKSNSMMCEAISAMKETLHSSVTKIESMCGTGLGRKRSGLIQRKNYMKTHNNRKNVRFTCPSKTTSNRNAMASERRTGLCGPNRRGNRSTIQFRKPVRTCKDDSMRTRKLAPSGNVHNQCIV